MQLSTNSALSIKPTIDFANLDSVSLTSLPIVKPNCNRQHPWKTKSDYCILIYFSNLSHCALIARYQRE